MAKPVGPHELWPIAAPEPGSTPFGLGVLSRITEPAHQTTDRRAGEAGAALRRREVIADALLDSRDAGGERSEFRARGTRQHPHQHLVADVGRRLARQGRQGGERLPFRRARQAAVLGIEHDHDAPGLRERHAGQHGRRPAVGPRSAIDEQTPLLESADAHARAQAAPERVCQGRRRKIESGPGRERATDGQRELRARTESGVRWKHLGQVEVQRLGDAREPTQRLEVGSGPLELGVGGCSRCGDPVVRRRAQLHLGFEPVDDQTQAAEPTSQRTGGIQKAQVEPPRRAHGDDASNVDAVWMGGKAWRIHRDGDHSTQRSAGSPKRDP